jgi:hypothetical protein
MAMKLLGGELAVVKIDGGCPKSPVFEPVKSGASEVRIDVIDPT